MVSVEAGIGMLIFILAFSYALLDVATYFRKEEQENNKMNIFKHALYFVLGYFHILLMTLLALIFVFVFLMVYNIILVGVFKPLISDNIAPSSGGYSAIVQKAKDGYFAIISTLAKLIFTTVFRVIDIKLALFLLMVFIPVCIFVVVIIYNLTIARESKIEVQAIPLDVRSTNYHYLTMVNLGMIVSSIGFIAFVGLQNANKI